MTYENLLKEVENEGIMIYESNRITPMKVLYADYTITLNTSIIETLTEKKCILAEELGHYHMTHGDIRDQSIVANVQQERKARVWAFYRLMGMDRLIKAFHYGVRNRYELSEYLDVTEPFIEEVLKYYKERYGDNCKLGNYTVSFDPLIVFMSFD